MLCSNVSYSSLWTDHNLKDYDGACTWPSFGTCPVSMPAFVSGLNGFLSPSNGILDNYFETAHYRFLSQP